MHFVLQTPSLQHLAGVKIVAHLWTQRCDRIRQRFKFIIEYLNLKYHSLNGNDTEWKAYEEKVENKVKALPLPQLLKQLLLNLVKPIGNEIVIWQHYHSKKRPNFHCLDILFGNHLRWTMRGTINYTKTAELMARDERVDVQRRYKIACLNCLEDEARNLIEFIPENVRRQFMNKRKYLDELDHHFLISYFTHTLAGKVNLVIRYLQLVPDASVNTFLFTVTLASGNRATCQYFFAKLNQREKEKILNECEKQRFTRPCASLYYLSLMNEQQQERMFRECTGEVLECLLGGPAQSLVVEAADCGSQVMQQLPYAFESRLSASAAKISFAFREYDYSYLFWEIWNLTSAEYKRDLLENFSFIDCLLRTKREEFIKLILNEASAHTILELCRRFNYNMPKWAAFLDEIATISDAAFMDENVIICDAALMECKQTAALNSENNPQDEEKRLRSQHVTRFVDIVIARRIKS